MVNRQIKLRRVLNKPIISEEDQKNLSREFHYNNKIIEVLQSYNPYNVCDSNAYDKDGYSSDISY
jgi:hypothetical protein